MLSSLSFSDNLAGDEEDNDKPLKMILWIQNGQVGINKKMHYIIFDDEVEQFNSEDQQAGP